MPTIHREGPYRFFLYSQDCAEPPHVRVQRENYQAKFWLDPIDLVTAGGFRDHELRDIERIITEHKAYLLNKWWLFCSE
jgi:hypothetical protein